MIQGKWGRLPGLDGCRSVGLFLLAVAAMGRLAPSRTGLLWDAQVYYYISERVASGIPPHVCEFDPKNALSMFLSGLAIVAGRVVGVDDVLAARSLSIAVTAATFPLLWSAVRRLGGTLWMACSTILLLLWFPEFLFLAVVGANPKIFLVFFEALWMLAATFDAPFVLGLLSAACFLTWQPSLLLLGAAGAMQLLRQDRPSRAVGVLLAGFVLPVAAYEAYFLWHGVLGEQIYQAFVFPAEFGRNVRSILSGASVVLQAKLPLGVTSALLCSFAALLAGSWAACILAPRRMWTWVRSQPARAAVLLAASGSLAFSFVDYQGVADRLFFLPFLAVVAGAAIGWMVAGVAAPGRRILPGGLPGRRLSSGVATASFAAVAMALVAFRIPDRGSGRNVLALQREAAKEVSGFVRRGNSVYAMGPLHLLAMNRLDNYNRFGFFPVRVSAYINRRLAAGENLLPLRDGKLPDIVLQTRGQAPGSAQWIERYYERVHLPYLDRERVLVLRLRKDVKLPSNASAM